MSAIESTIIAILFTGVSFTQFVAPGVAAPSVSLDQSGVGAGAGSSANQVVEKVTPQQVERYLNDLGFTGTEIDKDGDILFQMQGFRVLFSIGSLKGESLKMTVGIKAQVPLEKLNGWNQTKRYGRAFQREEAVYLESDLDLAGGVTSDRVKDYIKTFNALLTLFLKDVVV